MTNREIKLELVKAMLSSGRQIDLKMQEIYEWIVADEEVDVDVPETDYDKVSIGEVIKYIETNDLGHCGYGTRLHNILHASNISTVGDLLRIGRVNFAKYRDVGRGSVTRIDDALEELYGIRLW